jgi:hypothetical protein
VKSQKLNAIGLSLLTLLASMTACNGSTVAQDIVTWTPTIISTANVVGSTVSVLAPQYALVIAPAVAGFDIAAQTLSNQAQAYLANPGQTTLQALQTQVTTFAASVNAAMLQAAKITDPASQQKILVAIQALSVGVNAVLALVASIKGNTATAAPAAVRIAQVEPLMNRDLTIRIVADHYGVSAERAAFQVDVNTALLERAGF